MMFMNNDNGDDNDDEIPVKGDVKPILSLRTSRTYYEKKVNK